MADILFTAADVTVSWPSASTILALTPVILVVLGLVVSAMVDLIRAESVRYLPKLLWALIIVLFTIPLGALGYLVFGRDRAHKAKDPSRTVPTSDGARRAQDTGTSPSVNDGSAAPTGRRGTAVTTAAPGDPVVRTVGLTRDYGGSGLFDVDLCVPQGCVYGLVGPNGAGKTTMLSILAGTRRADSGSLRLSLPRAAIAVCPDVPEFDGWLTAWEVVDLARALTGADPNPDKVVEVLQVAGLADDADRPVATFSRGMTQRLGLACALAADPQLIILDEPTSALDPAGRADMLDLVSGMRGSRTVLFSSHILADVQRVADRVGILRQGRLLYQGPTQALIDTHLQPQWEVRVAGDASLLRAELGSQPWVRRVEPVGAGRLRIEAVTIEAGERGIPLALAACHERLVSCEPVAADLESAFLALTT